MTDLYVSSSIFLYCIFCDSWIVFKVPNVVGLHILRLIVLHCKCRMWGYTMTFHGNTSSKIRCNFGLCYFIQHTNTWMKHFRINLLASCGALTAPMNFWKAQIWRWNIVDQCLFISLFSLFFHVWIKIWKVNICICLLLLQLIIRAHEGPDARKKLFGLGGMDEGYSIDHDVASGRLITVFSAPDYPQFQVVCCAFIIFFILVLFFESNLHYYLLLLSPRVVSISSVDISVLYPKFKHVNMVDYVIPWKISLDKNSVNFELIWQTNANFYLSCPE